MFNRAALCEWQSPELLFKLAEAAKLGFGRKEFLNSNAAKPFREAWIIARAGMILRATGAKLSNNDPPDGYLAIDGAGLIGIEVTERFQKDRRRGDEQHSSIRELHQAELDAAIQKNYDWLKELIFEKLERDSSYPPRTVLLVYLNTSLLAFNPEEIQRECEKASRLRSWNVVGSLILYEGEIYGSDNLRNL